MTTLEQIQDLVDDTSADASVARFPKAARKSEGATKKTGAKKAEVKRAPAKKIVAKKGSRPKASAAKKTIVKAQVAAELETVVAQG
jgi:hypothetical protein